MSNPAASAVVSFPGSAPPPALPAPLVGRHAEQEHALQALGGGACLLTLSGLGGVGKTSLAQQLALSWTGEACWVECARLTEAAQLPAHLLTSLGVPLALDTPPLDVLRAHVAPDGPPVLIVLDNLEQIVDAALVVRDLLGVSPRLRFLVTSRVPLRLRDERLLPLAPLSPPEVSADPDELGLNDAVTLFVRAAHTVRPDFDLTPMNAADVARLCRRLDGLPLALELAARHMDVLGPQALLKLLERHGTLPLEGETDRPERHRSLDGLLESTYTLLSEEERRVFRHLAVFGTPFDDDDVRAVSDGPHAGVDDMSVLSTLMKFARQGLVRSAAHGERATFQMLETLRADAWHRLGRAGEREAALAAHAQHFHRFAHAADRLSTFQRYRLLRGRQDDLERAFGWFLARPEDDEDATRAALAMVWVVRIAWSMQGRVREGEAVFRRALARPGDFPAERPGAVVALAAMLSHMGQHDEAVRLAESVESDLHGLPDPIVRTLSLNNFAIVLMSAGRPERAIPVWEAVIADKVSQGLPDEQIDQDRYNVAATVCTLGRYEEGIERLLVLADRSRRRGELPMLSHVLVALSPACMYLGRLDEAERAALEARDLAEREGLHVVSIYAESYRCAVEVRRGPSEATVRALRDVIDTLERGGYVHRAQWTKFYLCLALLFLGQPHEARRLLECEVVGLEYVTNTRMVPLLSGLVALALGRSDEARGHFEAALTEGFRRENPLEYGVGLLGQASTCDTLGDPAGAERLRAEYAALLAEQHLTPWPALAAWPMLKAPSVATEVVPRQEVRPAAVPSVGLSARERDVLARLARGDTNKQIGRALGLSENTVRTHLRSVSQKLGEHTRTGILAHAARLGLVLVPDDAPAS